MSNVALSAGSLGTVVYYGAYEQAYLQLTGSVHRINAYEHHVEVGNTRINFDDIIELVFAL